MKREVAPYALGRILIKVILPEFLGAARKSNICASDIRRRVVVVTRPIFVPPKAEPIVLAP